jgi:hypothetical protein
MLNSLTARLALPAVVVLAALGGAASATATPLPADAGQAPTVHTVSPTTTQGIIMRDGGICDPIRHMGC